MGRRGGLRRRVDLGQLVDERGGDEGLEGVVTDAVDDGDRDAGDVDQVGERVGDELLDGFEARCAGARELRVGF